MSKPHVHPHSMKKKRIQSFKMTGTKLLGVALTGSTISIYLG